MFMRVNAWYLKTKRYLMLCVINSGVIFWHLSLVTKQHVDITEFTRAQKSLLHLHEPDIHWYYSTPASINPGDIWFYRFNTN